MRYSARVLRMLAFGVAIASATLLNACGGDGDGGPPWATVKTAVSAYRLDYQLDAKRRIKNYEMRDEASDRRVQWCSGDLHGSWECRDEVHDPPSSISAIVDEQGRPSSYSRTSEAPWGETIEYSHNADGRLVAVARNRWNYGNTITRTSTLEYDAVGQLTVIRLQVSQVKTPVDRAEFTYTIPSPSAVPTRLLMTKRGFEGGDFTIQLVEDGTGRYTQRIVNELTAVGERVASTVSYIIDPRGYVTSVVSERYQYEPGLTPVLRDETTACLDWFASADPALASEGSCPSATYQYSIVYPAALMPSSPLDVFPALSASSALDLLCVITDECVDPARLLPGYY